jgi:multiple sugar transport system ATP-binding protein
VEALGNELLISARLLEGGHLVQLRADPSQRVVPGQRIHIDVDPTGWRLFDAAGEALALPPAATAAPERTGPEPQLPMLDL